MNKKKNKILNQLLWIVAFFVFSDGAFARNRMYESACNELLDYANNGYDNRPLSPRYFSDPLFDERDNGEVFKDAVTEGLFELKNIGLAFKEKFKKGGAALIIGYNEGPDAKLRPGIYVQKGKNWFEIPTMKMADDSYYKVRPFFKRKDGSIESLHILTFYFHSALLYSVILDDFDELTQTGHPKIIVRNQALTRERNVLDCVQASNGKLGLRVFAKNLDNGEFVVGSSFEKSVDLRNIILGQEAQYLTDAEKADTAE